jgi:hypothetical protein
MTYPVDGLEDAVPVVVHLQRELEAGVRVVGHDAEVDAVRSHVEVLGDVLDEVLHLPEVVLADGRGGVQHEHEVSLLQAA